jgi:hypothetical protein
MGFLAKFLYPLLLQVFLYKTSGPHAKIPKFAPLGITISSQPVGPFLQAIVRLIYNGFYLLIPLITSHLSLANSLLIGDMLNKGAIFVL